MNEWTGVTERGLMSLGSLRSLQKGTCRHVTPTYVQGLRNLVIFVLLSISSHTPNFDSMVERFAQTLRHIGQTLDCLHFYEWLEALLLKECQHIISDCRARYDLYETTAQLMSKWGDYCFSAYWPTERKALITKRDWTVNTEWLNQQWRILP